MSRSQQRLCRLCEFPAADGGVPLDALDADKWAAWWRCTLGAEFKIETEQACTVICQFCICEARFIHENLEDDCSCGIKTGCDWWMGYSDDLFYQHYFYQKPLIQPCKVVLEKISSESGQDLLPTTAVLNASQIFLQDKLELKPHGYREKVKSGSTKKSIKEMFPCTFCKKIYNRYQSLWCHIKKSHKSAVKCKSKRCATFFLTDIKRRQHEKKVHLSEGSGKRLKCIFCGILLLGVSGELAKHIKRQHKEAIKCDFDYRSRCPNYFHTAAEKNKHILEVHNKVDLDLKICIYCGKTFKNKYNLPTHTRRYHADISIKCRFRVCLEYFFNRKESEEHFLKKHQYAQSMKKWQCPKCSFRTSRKESLHNHLLRLHTKEATLKCPLCPRSFPVKENLTAHLNTSHGERCTCEHCGKTMQKNSMQVHFLTQHAVFAADFLHPN